MKRPLLGVLVVVWFFYFGINVLWSDYFLAHAPTVSSPAEGRIYEFTQKGGTPRFATFEEWLYIQSIWIVGPFVVAVGVLLSPNRKKAKDVK